MGLVALLRLLHEVGQLPLLLELLLHQLTVLVQQRLHRGIDNRRCIRRSRRSLRRRSEGRRRLCTHTRNTRIRIAMHSGNGGGVPGGSVSSVVAIRRS